MRISFEEFLKSDIQKQEIEPIIPMDLDSQNPAVHRLIKNSARRVIKQHQKEIEALKHK
ncbi:hypothetical protein [Moraxella bovis]|uniref:Uncharacterized protein n=1 Tax=Moraxella bovis TaxID=476 RepID=A0A378PSD9_MORBO|nr:hypothetical protein [Moraxella bovis]UYZ76512.1 hypothetical protein LP093_04165 [Moraxella bovis]UYZ77536.1 hypothetical protein LP115_09645 [Moraxella bovis]UYZ86022.1 hypothetical protein LP094_09695 [Moraxella bovis]UYZ91455.1 hypothetical protein LP103_09750 [Moraxella bovis]UYZ98635.1 hypothetical protein LP107_04195 [Moraxella bovis]